MKGMIMLKTFVILWNMAALGLTTFGANFGYEFHFLFVQFTFAGAQIVFLTCLTIDLEQKIFDKCNSLKLFGKSAAYV